MDDPTEYSRQMYELLIKIGRRASHDLIHAAGFIRDGEWSTVFNDRGEEYLKILYPDNGPKNYLHSLHEEIRRLNYENETLRNLCSKHKIELPDDIQPF